jgi:glycosyltransferase involved in cell wall biosynthesis
MIRVLLISEIPTPYRMPAFEHIAAHPEIDLHVLFCAEDEPDRPWNLEREYAFSYDVLPGVAPAWRTRRDTFVYEINPTIFRALSAHPHDVLVISGYAVFAEQAALLWARVRGKPYVLLSESHLGKARASWKHAVKRLILPRLLGHASAGLAVGSAAADYLAHYGVARGRIRIFPNTIDVEAYCEAADRARANRAAVLEEIGLPERYLLYVGRLVERKGILDLIEAHRRLPADAPPLVVVGDGPLRESVAEGERVQALGFLEPSLLPTIYALAELAVIPSHDEPWGVAVNEALAAGTPVVASDAVGAARDLIDSGVNGLTYPAGDVAALGNALESALSQFTPPVQRGRIVAWNYEFATEQFVQAMSIATSGGSS